MGKSARKRRATERKKRKHAAKVAKAEAYQALAGTSKRAKRQRQKTVEPGRFNHETADCGNPGCRQCYDRATGRRLKCS